MLGGCVDLAGVTGYSVEGREGRGRRRKGREGAAEKGGWEGEGGHAEEGGKGGAEGAEGNFTWGWNWSNVLIPMKVRHWRGGGRGEGGWGAGRREGGKGGAEGAEGNYLRAELIKCIDPNEGEALRSGSTFKPGGLAPPTHLFHCLWGRGVAGGREAGGRI